MWLYFPIVFSIDTWPSTQNIIGMIFPPDGRDFEAHKFHFPFLVIYFCETAFERCSWLKILQTRIYDMFTVYQLFLAANDIKHLHFDIKSIAIYSLEPSKLIKLVIFFKKNCIQFHFNPNRKFIKFLFSHLLVISRAETTNANLHFNKNASSWTSSSGISTSRKGCEFILYTNI